MLNPTSPLARLTEAPIRLGRIVWIGLRPARRAVMTVTDLATLDERQGLIGDHYSSRTGGARHVTVIQQEHLAAIASHLGLATVAADLLRRNIIVAGINLFALKNHRFSLGEAVLEWTGECHPCSRMEEVLGQGGYNAVRGHGGITAQVIESGTIVIGDRLERLPATSL
ncbi:MOSC domain-containing protein YiiM [Bosea sp. 62]|uniref:MOSC domain-containing protein n=1 Tax=unclassified Bosea (in: a-proteobacteria) TaxID=2653178 RepID=UPI00125BD701|nr:MULTISPECIES: MOSC domain-containing protein [unclassified Bosea (in: a-proteobacteria)]CAD5291565.1 MOSC domain-containing protein YiiM [Bosea sp. 7B]CAD5299615.1 MOSC domain-containing protein YiiM [Bosea sp. 21B]CAD5299732.1 MOSC domain-containing protein YiiM [Bosea sp. 46]VVT61724.1 Molybdenum cofactor sulfurase [Bosea sp. EC-HK365B]VXB04484.1 MOSC domain-containing protein YiiM [Bosea sp. 127]